MKLKFSDDTETSIGEILHHTAKEATYQIEEGELITEVGVSEMSYMSNLHDTMVSYKGPPQLKISLKFQLLAKIF